MTVQCRVSRRTVSSRGRWQTHLGEDVPRCSPGSLADMARLEVRSSRKTQMAPWTAAPPAPSALLCSGHRSLCRLFMVPSLSPVYTHHFLHQEAFMESPSRAPGDAVMETVTP